MISIHLRRARRILALAGLVSFACARQAGAVAEVHHFNVVFSARPTYVGAKDFNNFIDRYNDQVLKPRGIEPLKRISYAWLFDTELRYLMRPNFAVVAGVGQLRSKTTREILPGLQQDVQIRVDIISVPIHIGGAYYFQPYNQGDFQARFYLGGGFLSQTYNFGRLEQSTSGVDPSVAPGFFRESGRGDAPGFYVESGVHMFFAARFSVLLGATYRSAMVRDMRGEIEIEQTKFPVGRIFDLDMSGVGARMGLAIGL
jgi:hypothetical protein